MVGTSISLDGITYRVSALLGRGKSAYSYLIENGGQRYVYKKMHDEPVDYYTFGNKLRAEVEAFEKLKAAGICLPELLAYSDREQFLVKEYIEGKTAAELAAEGALSESHFALAYAMHERLKAHGLHIDYFPTNFIFCYGQIFYIDYECHPYTEEWDFPSWGIFYWLNSDGMREHLETGHSQVLNLPGSPKPIWEPFLPKRDLLLSAIKAPSAPPPPSLWRS